jgi:hypothetical protein
MVSVLATHTWGYGSKCISDAAFPLNPGASPTKQTVRKYFIAAMRIYTTALNILGYLPWSAPISGLVRMAGAGAMAIASLITLFALKERAAGKELLIASLWQMARGSLEAFWYFPGVVINGVFDIISSLPEHKTDPTKPKPA